jgi:hypothetical protein
MKRPLDKLALALSLGVTSCDADRITSSDMGLALEVSISTRVIGPGQVATFTYQLRNVSSRTVTVIFGGCGPLPYVEDSRGKIVHPDGGGWLCPGAIRSATLASGEAISHTLQVAAGEPDVSRTDRVTLAAGRYRAYADAYGWVDDYDHRLELRSRDVSFLVRD